MSARVIFYSPLKGLACCGILQISASSKALSSVLDPFLANEYKTIYLTSGSVLAYDTNTASSRAFPVSSAPGASLFWRTPLGADVFAKRHNHDKSQHNLY